MHTFAIESVWLEKKIIDICSSSWSSKKLKKYLLAAGPDLSCCTSTLNSFRLLAHSLHLSLRFNIPG